MKMLVENQYQIGELECQSILNAKINGKSHIKSIPISFRFHKIHTILHWFADTNANANAHAEYINCISNWHIVVQNVHVSWKCLSANEYILYAINEWEATRARRKKRITVFFIRSIMLFDWFIVFVLFSILFGLVCFDLIVDEHSVIQI